ncbi:hypothetical protein [Acidovorax sp. NCPPB 3576]|uniref:hypothetical protein n=1 Tax=Acidovorax sp. NCPPB 3576 TaxID=2940488 RepID=UPI002349774D|nr:hypothetical protein [Acidovorax sp. NCPPB 3576]WCM90331.1 hypothetical protein M5C98_10090 [Acidovorax sp. NCPPB 3576]
MTTQPIAPAPTAAPAGMPSATALSRREIVGAAALSLSPFKGAWAGTAVAWPPEGTSDTAVQLVRWVQGMADNAGLPFAVIDKLGARLHVFAADGRWRGSAAVLLGSARGDASVPGIGDKPLSRIRPEERTTPAGRFVTEPGLNLRGDDIVWIDYDAAVSMHRLRSVSPAERRRERLTQGSAQDKRISYGCVNVDAAFYDRLIAPVFGQSAGVAYILPDTWPFATVFVAASAYQ